MKNVEVETLGKTEYQTGRSQEASRTGDLQGRLVKWIEAIKRGDSDFDLENNMPAAHDDSGAGGAGGTALGGGGCQVSLCGLLCIMLVAGSIMWGAGSMNCDESTFSGWGDSPCDVQNAGAIMALTAAGIFCIDAAIACCCLSILCPVACCAVVASEAN